MNTKPAAIWRFILGLVVSLTASPHSDAQPPGFLTNGLVAYYPFNGNANDESGNGKIGRAHV